jgi:hypothetical protein
MTVALVATNPQAIVATFPSPPSSLNLPNGEQVSGAGIGWASQDGAYALVAVVAFTAPAGQVATGSPSYAFNGASVVETYAATAAPLSFLQFMALFTTAEQIAIVSSVDPQVRLFAMEAEGAGSILLADAKVVGGINYLTTTTPPILTAAEAARILAGMVPS